MSLDDLLHEAKSDAIAEVLAILTTPTQGSATAVTFDVVDAVYSALRKHDVPLGAPASVGTASRLAPCS